MAARRKADEDSELPRFRPATTPDGRENQLIAIATDLAENQMRAGTASAQVISHYLKLGSSRERLEQHKLSLENRFLEEKTKLLESQQRTEELYKDALIAMSAYAGREPTEAEGDYED